MRRKIRLLTPIHGSAASGQIKLRPTTEPRSPAMHRALPALTALLVLLTGACSTSGGSDGIDQSSPRSLAVGGVPPARDATSPGTPSWITTPTRSAPPAPAGT